MLQIQNSSSKKDDKSLLIVWFFFNLKSDLKKLNVLLNYVSKRKTSGTSHYYIACFRCGWLLLKEPLL